MSTIDLVIEARPSDIGSFAGTSKERIEDAEKRRLDQPFPRIPGETEFVPLPPPRP